MILFRPAWLLAAGSIFDRSPVLGETASLGRMPQLVIPYVVVQIRAGGHLAEQMFPRSEPLAFAGATIPLFELGACALAVIMTLYVLVGGMRSVALTDVVQGILLLLGMLVSGAAILVAFGGVEEYFAAVSRLPADALSLPGPSGRYSPWVLMSLCVFASLGTMIQPAQWMRYYAARSTQVLRRTAILFASLLPVCFLFGVMLVGLGARALYPPEMVDGQIVPHEVDGTMSFKQLFDIGGIGFVVNVALFALVGSVTTRLDRAHVEKFKALMRSESPPQ